MIQIWAYGLRNPWQITFDSVRNELWVGDVGHNRIEELNLVRAGDNCGWNDLEGNLCYWPTENCRIPPRNRRPVVWHPHVNWCTRLNIENCKPANSITTGVWSYSASLPSLRNKFVYGEFELGHIYVLSIENSRNPYDNSVEKLVINYSPGSKPIRLQPVAFRKDSRGNIYIVNWRVPGIFVFEEVAVTQYELDLSEAMAEDEAADLDLDTASIRSEEDKDDDVGEFDAGESSE